MPEKSTETKAADDHERQRVNAHLKLGRNQFDQLIFFSRVAELRVKRGTEVSDDSARRATSPSAIVLTALSTHIKRRIEQPNFQDRLDSARARYKFPTTIELDSRLDEVEMGPLLGLSLPAELMQKVESAILVERETQIAMGYFDSRPPSHGAIMREALDEYFAREMLSEDLAELAEIIRDEDEELWGTLPPIK